MLSFFLFTCPKHVHANAMVLTHPPHAPPALLSCQQVPLLQLFSATSERVFLVSAHPGAGGSPEAYRVLMPMMDALRTMARIFYSLCWQVEWTDLFSTRSEARR